MSVPTRLLLLRHAAHDLAGRALAGRLPGLSLNAQGREQAEALAERLASCEPRITAVCSSPQPRAQQTAQPIAERLGLAVATAPEFDEIDFGAWTGKSFEDLRAQDGARWQQWCERRSQATPPGGEAFAGVPLRAWAGVERLCREHAGGCVLVVSHADVIKSLIARQLGLPLDHLERFSVDCASLSVLALGPGWSRLDGLNLIPG